MRMYMMIGLLLLAAGAIVIDSLLFGPMYR